MSKIFTIFPLRGVSLEDWAFRFFLGGVSSIAFSIAVGETLLGVAILLAVLSIGLRRQTPAWPRWAWGAAAFVAVAVLSCVWQRELPRGWSRLLRLFWLIVIPMTAMFVREHRRGLTVLQAFAIGCGILSLRLLIGNPIRAHLGVRAGVDWAPDFGSALIQLGSMTHGQMLMLGLLATLGIVFTARFERKRTAFWWVLVALQAAAFIVNLKRGSWICGLALLAVFVPLQTNWKSLLVVLAVAIVGLSFPAARQRLGSLPEEFDTGKGGRLAMWLNVLPGVVKDHPWGIGYGQMTNEKMTQYAPEVEKGRQHLHSNIPEVLAETGWLGLAVYLLWMIHALIVSALRLLRCRRVSRPEYLLALTLLFMFVGLLANGVVEYNFGDTELLIAMAVVMGLMTSAGDSPQRAETGTGHWEGGERTLKIPVKCDGDAKLIQLSQRIYFKNRLSTDIGLNGVQAPLEETEDMDAIRERMKTHMSTEQATADKMTVDRFNWLKLWAWWYDWSKNDSQELWDRFESARKAVAQTYTEHP